MPEANVFFIKHHLFNKWSEPEKEIYRGTYIGEDNIIEDISDYEGNIVDTLEAIAAEIVFYYNCDDLESLEIYSTVNNRQIPVIRMQGLRADTIVEKEDYLDFTIDNTIKKPKQLQLWQGYLQEEPEGLSTRSLYLHEVNRLCRYIQSELNLLKD